jgi:micrococcal nuclease
VTNIADGDTIRVLIDGVSYSVRYIGMNTAETGEPFSYPATLRNTQLVFGKTVILVKDVSEVDIFDRLLRYVIADGVFVNWQLVREGLAVVDTFPPDVACSSNYLSAQSSARGDQQGIWEPTKVPAPTQAGGGSGDNCHPSYPTVCIPPPPPDLDCGDISYRRFQVVGSDPHGFDGDGDGVGCESG